MKLGDIRTQANALAGSDLSLAEVSVIGNRMLIEIAPFLFLLTPFEVNPWQSGVASVPAPSDLIELRRIGLWYHSPNAVTRLERVAVDSDRPGWYFDGVNIGIRDYRGLPPSQDGVFKVWYYRHPQLLSGGDPEQEPEGGDIVGMAMVPYIVAEFYASLGDDTSTTLSARFRNQYEQIRNQIAVVRQRLVNHPPSSFGREP